MKKEHRAGGRSIGWEAGVERQEHGLEYMYTGHDAEVQGSVGVSNTGQESGAQGRSQDHSAGVRSTGQEYRAGCQITRQSV